MKYIFIGTWILAAMLGGILLGVAVGRDSEVKKAIVGLNYQTETDSAWSFQVYQKGEVSCAGVKRLLHRPTLSACEELDLAETFQHLISTQPQQRGYINLYNAISASWTGYSAFVLRRTDTQYDLVFVGFNSNGEVELILAGGVET